MLSDILSIVVYRLNLGSHYFTYKNVLVINFFTNFFYMFQIFQFFLYYYQVWGLHFTPVTLCVSRSNLS